MDIFSYVHKSIELLFYILGLVEVWTRRSMELSPFKSIPSMMKRSENTLISFRFEAKKSKKRLFRFALKRNEKNLEAKQSENTLY
jgi:hypothetical protein